MKIAVGLSGGIDSTVAAKILIEQGHEVCGVTLRLLSGGTNPCAEEAVLTEAAQAARALHIPHLIYDFRSEFEREIIQYFIESYRRGETPNPCYICNKRIKFGLFLDRALQEGFDAVATGHYAKIVRDDAGRWGLVQGADRHKDQSYFLALLDQRQLGHSIFPLAGLSKTAVRAAAERAGLINARKADSQDICFVPGGDYAAVIEAAVPEAFPPGNFVDMNGKKIGIHRGLHRYTIGQRRGLGLPFGYPVYVAEKSAERNTITVGAEEALFAASCTVREVNWIVEPPSAPFHAEVKTRYRQQPKQARVESAGSGHVRIVFDTPERAVARGQAAVFYREGRVLGGGIIAGVEQA
ncbi:MAG: tRNA 2-thiouridine(34) synthase MnmA [Treponema sp.]